MSEQAGEKTEDPTEQRLDEARKKGQVPMRKNAIEAGFLVLTVLIMLQAAQSLTGLTIGVMDAVLVGIQLDFQSALQRAWRAVYLIAEFSTAIIVGFGLISLALGLFLNRFNFALASLEPKFEKLNPVTGFKMIFSMQTLYNFGRLLVIFLVTSGATYVLLARHIQDMLNAAACGPVCVSMVFFYILFVLIFILLVVQIIAGVIDFRLQNIIFTRENRMTKDEVKREFKQSQGDPLIKGARTSIARQEANLPPLNNATHVVVGGNVLVALIYYPGSTATPYMLAKTRGTRVPELISFFKQNNCPVVTLPVQATTLFAAGAVGTYLPERVSGDVGRVLQAVKDQYGV